MSSASVDSASRQGAEPTSRQSPEAAGRQDPELLQRRERLTEQFALMQSELGGLFYEMAIRDHVKLDLLVDRAASLQRVEAELGQVELMIQEGSKLGGTCPSCGALYAQGSSFCSQCATPVPVG